MKTAYFNRFTIDMPDEAVPDCSHQGACDDDVAYWSERIRLAPEATPERIRAELKEYGAWDAEELADDAQNLQRIIWCAACNIKDEGSMDQTRIPCSCGSYNARWYGTMPGRREYMCDDCAKALLAKSPDILNP